MRLVVVLLLSLNALVYANAHDHTPPRRLKASSHVAVSPAARKSKKLATSFPPPNPLSWDSLWWLHTPKTAGVAWTMWLDHRTNYPTCKRGTIAFIDAAQAVTHYVLHTADACRVSSAEATMLEVNEELRAHNVTARIGFGMLVRDPVDHIISMLMHARRAGRVKSISDGLARLAGGEDLMQKKVHNLRHPQCNMLAPRDRPRRAEKELLSLAFLGLQELFVESKYLLLFSAGLIDPETVQREFEKDCREENALMDNTKYAAAPKVEPPPAVREIGNTTRAPGARRNGTVFRRQPRPRRNGTMAAPQPPKLSCHARVLSVADNSTTLVPLELKADTGTTRKIGAMDAHRSHEHSKVMLSVVDLAIIQSLAVEDRSLWIAARRIVHQRLRYMEASLGIVLRCSPMAKYGYADPFGTFENGTERP